MALAFAPFDAWPLIFVSLPIFFLLLQSSAMARSALTRGFAFGYGYFMVGTWWIANAMLVDVAKFGWMIPLSVLGLSAALAVYFALFGWLNYKLRHPQLWANMLRFTALWVGVEYLRSIGIFGFPWNLAGYIALATTQTAQAASIIGTFGLSLMVVFVGVVPVLWSKANSRIAALIIPVVTIGALYGYGAWRIPTAIAMTSTHIALVQPSVPQTLKGTQEGAIASAQLLAQNSATAIIPDAVIWPETAYPGALRRDSLELPPTVHAPLLTGIVRIEGEGEALRIYNSFAAVDAKGALLMTYDKHQLVPFGEFVPLRSVLPLQKITPGSLDFSRGPSAQTLHIAKLPPVSPLICYEVIFPWMAVDANDRPAWMVNVTNDGWYGDSPGPYQHFAMARMRAIEQGLPLARAANNGISAIVDPYGRVVQSFAINARGVLVGTLPQPIAITPYAQSGEGLSILLLGLVFIVTFLPQFRKKSE